MVSQCRAEQLKTTERSQRLPPKNKDHSGNQMNTAELVKYYTLRLKCGKEVERALTHLYNIGNVITPFEACRTEEVLNQYQNDANYGHLVEKLRTKFEHLKKREEKNKLSVATASVQKAAGKTINGTQKDVDEKFGRWIQSASDEKTTKVVASTSSSTCTPVIPTANAPKTGLPTTGSVCSASNRKPIEKVAALPSKNACSSIRSDQQHQTFALETENFAKHTTKNTNEKNTVALSRNQLDNSRAPRIPLKRAQNLPATGNDAKRRCSQEKVGKHPNNPPPMVRPVKPWESPKRHIFQLPFLFKVRELWSSSSASPSSSSPSE